jgi:feruloyl esterase
MVALGAGAARAGASCESLTDLKLPHVTITEARVVEKAPFGPAGQAATPSYCRVLATARPTPDSDIRIEVAIPEGEAWNGRYLQVGNGGFAGTIPERAILPGLAAGYAVAGTDDGHQSSVGTDASWALGHPEKVVDFGYRALKETTDAAKAIIAAHAQRTPKYSYFLGCSDGGREALMEAQRYPDDFDGIVAGDPANRWTHLLAGSAWNAQALNATPASAIPRGQAEGPRSGGAQGLRRPRRGDRKPADLQIRPRGHPLRGRGRERLPDRRPGRGGAENLRRRPRSPHRQKNPGRL